MRFNEFRPLVEDFDDVGTDISAHVEDDADHEADNALAGVLRRIQFSGAKLPKITVASLIKLVNNEPGGEAFDKFALEKAKANNETIKEMIKNIESDNNGIEYVFINPPEPIDDPQAPGQGGTEGGAAKTAPEKTVSAMANRALGSRS